MAQQNNHNRPLQDHQEEGRRRQNDRPALHPIPTYPDIRLEYFDQPAKFFQGVFPFSERQIHMFAEREGEWEAARYCPMVLDKGGQRLYIWNDDLPDPGLHWDECVKRFPPLAEIEGGRDWFIAHSRAQNEMKGHNNTSRCPLCGSNLFGYPLSDHQYQDCIFTYFHAMARLKFQSVNLVTLCNMCNSRSGTHTVRDCQPKVCDICRQYGHTAAQDLCDVPVGRSDTESQRTQREAVDDNRSRFLRNSRALMMNPDRPLKYRFFTDTRFFFIIKRLKEKRNEGRVNIAGWGIDEAAEYELPYQNQRYYQHHHIGRTAYYPGLVPTEFNGRNALAIPQFDQDVIVYLQSVAKTVDNIRLLGKYLPPTMPPGLERFRPLTPPLEVVAPRQAAAPIQQPATTQQSIILSKPADQLSLMEMQQLVATMSQSLNMMAAQQSTQINSLERGIPVGANWAELMEEEDRKRVTRDTASSSSTNRQASPSTSSNGQNNRPLPIQKTTPPKVQQDPSRPRSQLARKMDQMREEMGVERDIRHQVMTVLRESIVPDGWIVRQQFQTEAFRILSNSPFPESEAAMKTRARSYQLVLCGTSESQGDQFENATDSLLKLYLAFLQKIGNTIQDEKHLLVALENRSETTIMEKVNQGRGDFYPVPSFRIWLNFAGDDGPLQALIAPRIAGELHAMDRHNQNPTRGWYDQIRMNDDSSQKVDELHHERARYQTWTTGDWEQIKGYLTVDPTVLREASERRCPRFPEAMRIRIMGLTALLTGKTDAHSAYLDNHILIKYIELLQNACYLIAHIREEGLMAKVDFVDCHAIIGKNASRYHRIVLPTVHAFSNIPLDRWVVFYDYVWMYTHDQILNARCNCFGGPREQN